MAPAAPGGACRHRCVRVLGYVAKAQRFQPAPAEPHAVLLHLYHRDTEEPARYAALVAALKAQWERDSRTLPAAEALRATQPYIALCRT